MFQWINYDLDIWNSPRSTIQMSTKKENKGFKKLLMHLIFCQRKNQELDTIGRSVCFRSGSLPMLLPNTLRISKGIRKYWTVSRLPGMTQMEFLNTSWRSIRQRLQQLVGRSVFQVCLVFHWDSLSSGMASFSGNTHFNERREIYLNKNKPRSMRHIGFVCYH